jgi:choline dehydrogenase-like flavoprotein
VLVDAAGHVFGLANLVVTDASIMPTIPANTNLSTIALAERSAESLAGDSEIAQRDPRGGVPAHPVDASARWR